ncbi:MAG: hypothetical protein RBU30_19495 [Polyangia bacterium]|jgi:hypothetical protein|nr:hypothetical protein [Polyangia bacterium]
MTAPVSSIQIAGVRLTSEVPRPRTTPRPQEGFQEVLRTGAQVLLAGASAASGLLGGPLLSSAIEAARSGLAQGSPQGGTGAQGASFLSGTSGGSSTSPAGSGAGAGGALGAVSGTGSASSEIEAMRQLQKEGQQHNLQYLQLQQEAQEDNRRFSLASSLLKARHDTARSAINNLRV